MGDQDRIIPRGRPSLGADPVPTERTAPAASAERASRPRLTLRTKRTLDIVGGVCALIVFSPLTALCALLVRVTMGRPVMFHQVRVGLGRERFELVKFRTMRNPANDAERFFTDGERVTTVGRIMRAFSLDELPELWQVVKGDMSLVGPRPLLPEYVGLYSERQAIRHDMRPGLTGLAQVSGRQGLTLSERLDLDADYVETFDLGLDFKILLLTVWQVLRRQGVDTGQDLSDIDDIGLQAALAAGPSDHDR